MKYIVILLMLIGSTKELFMDSHIEDLCTTPRITDKIANAFAKFTKNFIKPIPRRDVHFFLYTRNNPKKGQRLYLRNRTSILNSNFDIRYPVRIIIHGFQNSLRDCVNVLIRKAYLKRAEYNVIVVDWSIMSSSYSYLTAILWLKYVADVINDFTKFLYYDFQIPFDNMYLIGHSLGAHIAGLTGRRLKVGKYNTIFGLDPAGPAFYRFLHRDVVQSGDATYVETIHTDMKKFGIQDQLGDASVYPHYGYNQKRCSLLRILLKFDVACNHSSAYIYFAESITNPEKFLARRCTSFKDILWRKCKCVGIDCRIFYRVGGDPSTKKTGVFYMEI